MRRKVIRVCQRPGCGRVFEVLLSQSVGKFCSRACYHAARAALVRVCARPGCGREFKAPSTNARRGYALYCSQTCFFTVRARPALDLFWEKVDKDGPNGCWLWLGDKVYGYGYFSYSLDGKSRRVRAHRFSWQLAHPDEAIPDGIQVCHNCPGGDRRDCVNPAHLFLGSATDNMQDAARKGRMAIALDESRVREIRIRYAAGGVRQVDLAAEYGVSGMMISDIVRGNYWTHAGGPISQANGRWTRRKHLD